MATPTNQNNRSTSRTRHSTPPPQPTTPLRPPSRSSLRSSYTPLGDSNGQNENPVASLEPAFAELSDGMADLEANFMHLQILNESLSRFSECFASFMYGLNVNAFCVDFPEAPAQESFRRAKDNPAFMQPAQHDFARSANSEPAMDMDQTFLTTDTSFVDNPPASFSKTPTPASRFQTPRGRGAATRGSRGSTTSRGIPRGTTGRGRASGLARATNRGRGSVR